MSGDAIRRLSLSALCDALQTRQLSSVEVTRACLEAIEARNGLLNAWLSTQPELALERAAEADAERARSDAAAEERALLGVPLGVKDNFCTTDLPTTCASRLLAGYRSPFESTPTARLRAAGAVLLGKTNLDEFAMGGSTERSAAGPCCNPLDTERSAGGSSGGSACAVADLHCPAALGSDTGGSIRQPAAFCGVVGIKPTWGRVSRYGLVAFASSLDQAGTLSRTVEDGARLLEVIAGHDRHDATSARRPVPALAEAARRGARQGLRGVTLGVPREVFDLPGLQPGVAAAVRTALEVAERDGASLREVALPHLRYAVATYYLICTAEASSNLARFDGMRYGQRVGHEIDGADLLETYAKSRGAGFGEEVKRRIVLGTFVLSEGYHEQYYGRAQRARTLLRQDLEAALSGCDAIALPTAPRTAMRLGELVDDPLEMYLTDVLTVAANLAGLPALSLPCGLSSDDGLPVGLQLIAAAFEEARLLEVAAALEHMHGSRKPQPAEARKARLHPPKGGPPKADGGPGGWQTVIGLEIHVQLRTASKMFSAEPVDAHAAPNTAIGPVTLGLPGALPVVNGRAIELAVRAGLALGCRVRPVSVFARKNYFYPDLPKGYQISQFEAPICEGGELRFELDGAPRSVRLTRIHLEEDTGKSSHLPGQNLSAIDYNRAGVPLIEVVTEPELDSPQAAAAAMRALHEIVVALGVSDANMELGQFRCDANVSIRRAGAPLGTRTEIKNLNSFRFVEQAVRHELARQIALVEGGGAVEQQTRLYDADADETRLMRRKERADDYRYFPDPDLPAVVVDEAWLEDVRASLPELPAARRRRYVEALGLPVYDAGVLTASAALGDFFEAVLAARGGREPKAVSNLVMGDVLRVLNEQQLAAEGPIGIASLRLDPQAAARLLDLIDAGALTRQSAREVFDAMLDSGQSPDAIVEARGLAAVSDEAAVEAALREMLARHPDELARYRGGEKKLMGWLMGSAMRAVQGRADAQLVKRVLLRLLG